MSRKLTVTWRDEAYGARSGARCAFRLYDTFNLTDGDLRRIRSKARKAGFRWDEARCAWIACRLDAAHRLAEGLQALGFEVVHAGRWSELPPLQTTAP
jgi:hypothetical protein